MGKSCNDGIVEQIEMEQRAEVDTPDRLELQFLQKQRDSHKHRKNKQPNILINEPIGMAAIKMNRDVRGTEAHHGNR